MNLENAENIVDFFQDVSEVVGMPSSLKSTLISSFSSNWDLKLLHSMLGSTEYTEG